GVATVAFDYGAAREYLRNGENGAAVDNDEQFIDAAVQLAANDAQRHMLGSNAARAMKRLHPQQVVAEFDALLAELAARARKAGHALAISGAPAGFNELSAAYRLSPDLDFNATSAAS
ncbi:hypothetical protein, partial [Klebsiella pneumoniae]|uniref:hypothetical protein n=1 Tax=Klebsiella pneumoniae TaxID=573 RepID=UPI0037C0D186